MLPKTAARLRRKERVRKKVRGNLSRPRLSVSRSLKNLYAQLIDDSSGATLFGLSTHSKGFKKDGGNVKGAKEFGIRFAKGATEKKFSEVVFDRGGFQYHGRVKAFAEGVREGGLKF